jgi:hypothetical protein
MGGEGFRALFSRQSEENSQGTLSEVVCFGQPPSLGIFFSEMISTAASIIRT